MAGRPPDQHSVVRKAVTLHVGLETAANLIGDSAAGLRPELQFQCLIVRPPACVPDQFVAAVLEKVEDNIPRLLFDQCVPLQPIRTGHLRVPRQLTVGCTQAQRLPRHSILLDRDGNAEVA